MALGVSTFVKRQTALAVGRVRKELQQTANGIARLEDGHDSVKFCLSGARLALAAAKSVINVNVQVCNGCIYIMVQVATSSPVQASVHVIQCSIRSLLTGTARFLWNLVAYFCEALARVVPKFKRLYRQTTTKCIEFSSASSEFVFTKSMHFQQTYVTPAVSSVVFDYMGPGFSASYTYTKVHVRRIATSQMKMLQDNFPGSSRFLHSVIRVVAKFVVYSSRSIESISAVPQRIVRRAIAVPVLVR